MRHIQLFSLIVFSCFALSAQSSTISGIVNFKGKTPKGVLFVFAKKHDGSMPMPLAVKRIVSPKFPVKFSLSAADKMIPDLPFDGPFTIVARLSPSGNAMDKSGMEVSTTTPIKLGQKNLKLVLKNSKK